ncbi:MAG: response regulator [Opitutales bacterium]|nr:response regulator [Opitutales bacterium]
MKILLIEDNPRNAYLVRYILEHAGFSVDHAGDGPVALKKADTETYRLVILDIQLPGMDGYAVAQALRRQPRTRDLPIIAVTSHAMVGDRERALQAGCDGYIEKPIDPVSFIGEIRAALDRNTATAQEA